MLPAERLSCLAKESKNLYNIPHWNVSILGQCAYYNTFGLCLTSCVREFGYLYSEIHVLKRTTRLPRLMHPTVYAFYHIGYGIPNGLLSLEGIGYKPGYRRFTYMLVVGLPGYAFTCVIQPAFYMGMKKQLSHCCLGRGEKARIRLDEHLGP